MTTALSLFDTLGEVGATQLDSNESELNEREEEDNLPFLVLFLSLKSGISVH